MQLKKTIEHGHLVTVRLYEGDEDSIKSEEDVKVFFEKQKEEGFSFFKAFRRNGIPQTLFMLTSDLEKILNSNVKNS